MLYINFNIFFYIMTIRIAIQNSKFYFNKLKRIFMFFWRIYKFLRGQLSWTVLKKNIKYIGIAP